MGWSRLALSGDGIWQVNLWLIIPVQIWAVGWDGSSSDNHATPLHPRHVHSRPCSELYGGVTTSKKQQSWPERKKTEVQNSSYPLLHSFQVVQIASVWRKRIWPAIQTYKATAEIWPANIYKTLSNKKYFWDEQEMASHLDRAPEMLKTPTQSVWHKVVQISSSEVSSSCFTTDSKRQVAASMDRTRAHCLQASENCIA